MLMANSIKGWGMESEATFSRDSGLMISRMMTAYLKTVTVLGTLFAAFILVCPVGAAVSPQAAERFTHLLGVSLAGGIDFNVLARQFGASTVIQRNDAETPDTRVCYRSASGKQTVEFFHGDINAGFALRDVLSKDSHCPVSKAITADKLKVAELSLGMSRTAFEALLGKSANATANGLTYQFQYVYSLTDAQLAAALAAARKQGYDSDKPEDLRNRNVGIYIQAGFKDNHLNSLVVDRVETN
jgi:hypothetical protein